MCFCPETVYFFAYNFFLVSVGKPMERQTLPLRSDIVNESAVSIFLA